MCFGMIGSRPGDMASRIAGCGWLRRTIAVERVGRLDIGDRGEHRLERMIVAGGDHRERHVVGRDRHAVVEDGTVDEVQGDREAVFGDVPALGQVWLWVEFVVEQQRARIELGAGHRGCITGLDRAVQVARHLGASENERAAWNRITSSYFAVFDIVGTNVFEFFVIE